MKVSVLGGLLGALVLCGCAGSGGGGNGGTPHFRPVAAMPTVGVPAGSTEIKRAVFNDGTWWIAWKSVSQQFVSVNGVAKTFPANPIGTFWDPQSFTPSNGVVWGQGDDNGGSSSSVVGWNVTTGQTMAFPNETFLAALPSGAALVGRANQSGVFLVQPFSAANPQSVALPANLVQIFPVAQTTGNSLAQIFSQTTFYQVISPTGSVLSTLTGATDLYTDIFPGINSHNVVVGAAVNGGQAQLPYRWDSAGAIHPLTVFAPSDTFTIAEGISDSGIIVGEHGSSFQDSHALLWTSDTAVVELQTLCTGLPGTGYVGGDLAIAANGAFIIAPLVAANGDMTYIELARH